MTQPVDTAAPPAFADLLPAPILDAVEALGLRVSGHLQALNSYENRVYQIGLEDAAPVIAKFYRQGRWTDAAIREEHDFALELAGHEVPVVAPLRLQGNTLHHHAGYRYALFPRVGGHWPALDDEDTQLRLGQLLGRLHAVGASRGFAHRPTLAADAMLDAPAARLRASGLIPDYLRVAYDSLIADLRLRVLAAFAAAGEVASLRLHGDFHPGNVLAREAGLRLVDLDDCRMGPAIQDLWMLLSGERAERSLALSVLLEGYETFMDFDRRELLLIEPLRTLRMVHYAGWLAERANEPAFQQAFPWFGAARYWEEHILALREQLATLDEAPLVV